MNVYVWGRAGGGSSIIAAPLCPGYRHSTHRKSPMFQRNGSTEWFQERFPEWSHGLFHGTISRHNFTAWSRGGGFTEQFHGTVSRNGFTERFTERSQQQLLLFQGAVSSRNSIYLSGESFFSLSPPLLPLLRPDIPRDTTTTALSSGTPRICLPSRNSTRSTAAPKHKLELDRAR